MRFIQIDVDDLVAAEHVIRVSVSTDGPKATVSRLDLIDGQSVYTALTVAQVLELSGAELASLTDRGLALFSPVPPAERY